HSLTPQYGGVNPHSVAVRMSYSSLAAIQWPLVPRDTVYPCASAHVITASSSSLLPVTSSSQPATLPPACAYSVRSLWGRGTRTRRAVSTSIHFAAPWSPASSLSRQTYTAVMGCSMFSQG